MVGGLPMWCLLAGQLLQKNIYSRFFKNLQQSKDSLSLSLELKLDQENKNGSRERLEKL